MKKVFCIFAVVLILIMATVPCFALNYSFTRYFYNFSGTTTIGDSYYGLYQTSELKEHFKYLVIFCDSDYTYYTLYLIRFGQGNPYSYSLYNYRNQPLIIDMEGYTGFFIGVQQKSQSYYYKFLIFGSDEPTLDPDFLTYYNIQDFSDIPAGYYTLTHGGLSDSFISFYSNIFSSFGYFFSNLYSLYSPFLILFSGILLICLLIFVFFLIFKRSRT